ncbi:hypothetical protein V8F06_008509 [Rhypophila decipiens]
MKELDTEEDPPQAARPHLPDHEGTQAGGHAKNIVPIPPQPGPAVQETSFAPDASSELVVLAHEPIPDQEHQPNYGTTATNNMPGPASTQNANKPSQARSIPPDLLRGLLMILMALDHNVMTLRSWPHGTAIDGETDSGVPSKEWNTTLAYTIRTLTHLCAPGFMFLLGMGIVYFGRSRSNLGWKGSRMIRHFAVRGIVLMALSSLMGVVLSGGRIWLLNIVLVALGVDYFLVGTGWVFMNWTEAVIARMVLGIVKSLDGKMGTKKIADGEEEPLLPPATVENGQANEEGSLPEGVAPDRSIILAADISWHLHNFVLLTLAIITIWWNIWLSPTGGGCFDKHHDESAPGTNDWSSHGSGGFKAPESIIGFRFWFYPVSTGRMMSGFPPLAWISFAILGLLYGRIILARSWSARAITAGNILAAVVFTLIFVATRLFHVGNLSEGCLRMPEHGHGGNQYLASPASFFYLVKYPPDVAFWAYTMAVNFLCLAFFSNIPADVAARYGKILVVYGTSALFFYMVHIPLLGLISETVFVPWLGHDMDFDDVMSPGKKAVGVDNLWAFFANWLIVLVLLYPACWWYGGFKKTRSVDSIWRFF